MSDSPDDDFPCRPPLSGGKIRALFAAVFAAFACAGGGLCCAVMAALGFKKIAQLVLDIWAHSVLFVCGTRVAVSRPASLTGQPCVFLSNHQSALDIPVLMTACRQTHIVRFMAKESLFKIPLFGWGMRQSGFVPIRREDARHSAEVFKELLDSDDARERSYIIFPEGTRSPDGRLQTFKRGSLGIALRMGRPVVPVTLIDLCRANPRRENAIRAGTVRVVFHEPVEIPADTGPGARDELMAKVYAAILSALPEDQKPL